MSTKVFPQRLRTPVRRALSIAVSYKSQPEDLHLWLDTTYLDPPKLRNLLTEVYNWREPDDEITILCDHPYTPESNAHSLPTRENIIRAMEDLVRDAQAGDEFVFHYAGHGSQIPNYDGSEKDDLDETIFPCDVQIKPGQSWEDAENYIVDNDIKKTLIDPLPRGTRLIMIFDSCHSGTASDLPTYNDDLCPVTPTVESPTRADPSSINIKTRKISRARGAESDHHQSIFSSVSPNLEAEPYVTSWSACKDNQLSYEDPYGGGLFLEAFVRALRRNPHPTHFGLLAMLNKELRQTFDGYSSSGSDSEPNTPALRIEVHPQLGCNGSLVDYADQYFDL